MPQYLAIETRANSEENTARRIAVMAEQYNIPIYSILFNSDIRGYIFIECETRKDIPFLIKEISTARRLLKGKATEKEVLSMVKVEEESIGPGDRVVIVNGPFDEMEAEGKEVKDGKVIVVIDEWSHPGRITLSRGSVRLL